MLADSQQSLAVISRMIIEMARYDWAHPDVTGLAPDSRKPPVATPGAAPFQEASLSSTGGHLEAIQASTAVQYQATRQGPSWIR